MDFIVGFRVGFLVLHQHTQTLSTNAQLGAKNSLNQPLFSELEVSFTSFSKVQVRVFGNQSLTIQEK
jgi:hypothetical protein